MSTETVFECPKCRRQGLVRLHSEGDIFECIYCHYKSDLTKEDASEDGASWLTVLVLAVIVALVVTGL